LQGKKNTIIKKRLDLTGKKNKRMVKLPKKKTIAKTI
jgi:hypothetical protein